MTDQSYFFQKSKSKVAASEAHLFHSSKPSAIVQMARIQSIRPVASVWPPARLGWTTVYE